MLVWEPITSIKTHRLVGYYIHCEHTNGLGIGLERMSHLVCCGGNRYVVDRLCRIADARKTFERWLLSCVKIWSSKVELWRCVEVAKIKSWLEERAVYIGGATIPKATTVQ